MTEATCKREIELEIPAENVQKATEKVARDIARVARVPGFRPGKAPVALVRRRFAEDIQGEVLQSLVPEYLEKALDEKKMVPVTRPEVNKVEFKDGEPLKFRAVFEVLPEFDLGDYKNVSVQVDDVEIGDAQVDKAIEEMRERGAVFVPVEGRAAQTGDSVSIKLAGTPVGEGEPVQAENILVHLGSEETLASFTDNLTGARVGETKNFRVVYPEDYPDPKLSGKTYDYAVDVLGIKEKKLPELNDEFAKEAAGENAGISTLDQLRKKIGENLEAHKEHEQKRQARSRIIEALVKGHDFPVPEALVEERIDMLLEDLVRSLVAQGIDPRAVNLDWRRMRNEQRGSALDRVKAEILIDRIASAENIEATDEDVDKEIESMAERSGEAATSLRARLTKQNALDRIKSKLRSDKTLDWLCRTSRIEKTAEGDK